MTVQKIKKYINKELKDDSSVEKWYVLDDSKKVEVLVVTKKISPSTQEKVIKLEDEIKEKYSKEATFRVLPSNTQMASFLNDTE